MYWYQANGIASTGDLNKNENKNDNYEEHYNDDYDYQNSVDYDVTGEKNTVQYLADFNQIDKILEPPRFQKRQEIFRTIRGNSVSILPFLIITKSMINNSVAF